MIEILAVASLLAGIEPVAPADAKVPVKASAIEPDTYFIDAELLWWRPDQNGMGYCMVSNELSPALLGDRVKEKGQTSSSGLGLRIGAGMQLGERSADVGFYWTSFHHSVSNSVKGPVIFSVPLWGPGTELSVGGDLLGGGGAKSRWHLKLDLLELDVGYRIPFRDQFVLRPYLGVAGGWIDQMQHMTFDHFFFNQAELDGKVEVKRDFVGIGPKLGMTGDLALKWGFGLFGNLAGVLFYGWVDAPSQIDVAITPPSPAPNPEQRIRSSERQIFPALQAQAGLNWHFPMFENGEIYFMVAYEAQYFWNVWQRFSSVKQTVFVSNTGSSDLSLSGMTFQAKLSF